MNRSNIEYLANYLQKKYQKGGNNMTNSMEALKTALSITILRPVSITKDYNYIYIYTKKKRIYKRYGASFKG